MTAKPRRIGLYYDEKCTHPIPTVEQDGQRVWILDFGRLDSGNAKTGSFYIWNQTDGVIEELEVSMPQPDKKGVEAELISEARVAALEAGSKHKVQIRWRAAGDVKAGRCIGKLVIRGFLTRE